MKASLMCRSAFFIRSQIKWWGKIKSRCFAVKINSVVKTWWIFRSIFWIIRTTRLMVGNTCRRLVANYIWMVCLAVLFLCFIFLNIFLWWLVNKIIVFFFFWHICWLVFTKFKFLVTHDLNQNHQKSTAKLKNTTLV